MAQVEVNGTTLHYRFDGPDDGPVVMLSNSLATNLAMWDAQVPTLTGAGFRVLRYDSRGHGQSSAPAGDYTMDMLARDVVGLLDALELPRVRYCGLSKGGMVGQMLGTKFPDRVICLSLCDTAAYTGGVEAWNGRIQAARDGGMESLIAATVDRWVTKDGQARLPADVEKVREMIRTTPVDGYCGCCAAIRDMDQRETIRAITTPTQVIVGDQDQGTTVAMATLIHESIPGSDLVILPDAAHLSNIEQTERFNQALIGFLRRF